MPSNEGIDIVRKISGKDMVNQFLENRIQLAENEFLSDIKGIEREFITLILSIIEGSLSQDSLQNTLNVEIDASPQTIRHDSIQLLNTLFEKRNINTINLTHPQNAPGIVGSIATGLINPKDLESCVIAFNSHFENVSKLKTLLLQCQMSEHYEVELDDQDEPNFDTAAFRNARNEWLNNSKSNQDWESFFFNNDENKLENFEDEISQMIEATYGFQLSPLYFIYHFLELSRGNRDRIAQSVPSAVPITYLSSFTTLPRDAIEGPLRDQFPEIDDDEVDALLKGIEYSTDKYPSQAPFFPLLRNGTPAYYVWTSVPGFLEFWLSDILKQGGTLKTRYGDSFDIFVRERISKHTVLSSLPNGIRIKKGRFSDMTEAFEGNNRMEIQIDAFAWDADRTFVISCKAHDFFFDQEQHSKLFFIPYSDFYSRTLRNFVEINEVCMWTSILKSSDEFMEEFGVGSKKLVPMLITPRRNPLQINSVRTWFSDLKQVRIPNCEVLSIEDLEEKYKRN